MSLLGLKPSLSISNHERVLVDGTHYGFIEEGLEDDDDDDDENDAGEEQGEEEDYYSDEEKQSSAGHSTGEVISGVSSSSPFLTTVFIQDHYLTVYSMSGHSAL